MVEMIRQTAFTTGEVDEITWKRTDMQEYLTAAQSLKNCEVGTTGLAKKRKGSEILANVTAYATPNSRLYEFRDKDGNYYCLISADKKINVFDAPTSKVQVITGRKKNVVTGRGTFVVAKEDGTPFVQAVDVPYELNNLGNLDYTQDNDSIIYSSGRYAPGRVFIDDYATTHFTFQYLDIYPLPAYDFNTINYNSFTVNLSVAGSELTFQFTGLSGDPGFNNDWIGGQIVGGGESETSPLGYAIITSVSFGGGTTEFKALIQIPFQTSGFATIGSQYSVKKPVWKTPAQFPTPNPITSGYPKKVLFFQNRLWFANTNLLNSTVFGSKINTPISFDVGTGKDTDAIIYTIGQTDSGEINWINGGKQLEIYSQNYEFACPQDQNSALTPSTFSIRQQSSYGSSNKLKPVTYINDSYYSNKTGKAVINFHFNGVGLTYVASNISAASSHLIKDPANRALQRGTDTTQDNFIYFLNPDDETLSAFQFINETKLAAFTPIEFQENIEVIDITTIDNDIYILKFFTLTSQYTLERFNPDVKMDSYMTATMQSSGLVTGLSLFNGYTVQVVYENQDFGQYLVSGGQITVENPEEISDTVFVGLLYDVEIIPMYPFAGQNASSFFKNISTIYIDYYQSLNFFINGKLVPYQNFNYIQAGLPLTPQTDTAIFYPVNGWDRNITGVNDAIVITQSSPFDLQILGIGYEIEKAAI